MHQPPSHEDRIGRSRKCKSGGGRRWQHMGARLCPGTAAPVPCRWKPKLHIRQSANLRFCSYVPVHPSRSHQPLSIILCTKSSVVSISYAKSFFFVDSVKDALSIVSKAILDASAFRLSSDHSTRIVLIGNSITLFRTSRICRLTYQIFFSSSFLISPTMETSHLCLAILALSAV